MELEQLKNPKAEVSFRVQKMKLNPKDKSTNIKSPPTSAPASSTTPTAPTTPTTSSASSASSARSSPSRSKPSKSSPPSHPSTQDNRATLDFDASVKTGANLTATRPVENLSSEILQSILASAPSRPLARQDSLHIHLPNSGIL